ncbi:MAG: S41 family peptidase [Flavisolibacter sp.]
MISRRLFTALSLGLILFSSCKKNDLQNNLNPTVDSTTTTVSAADKLKDSALEYSKDIYLWYNQISPSFNARSYADLDKLMTGIRQYSIEPGFSTPVDRWSFGIKQQEWDDVSSGISGDFGINVFFRQEGDLRVKSVERTSPAGLAGVRRGWKIVKLNGSSNMTTSNADFIVNAVWNSSSSSFTFEKPDGTMTDMNLVAASYQEHPVFLDTVYSVNSKNVGYLSFNSFLGDTNEVYSEFSRVFNRFAASSVTDVIVDLRYNGGGYVSVQEKLANYLAPSSANGQLMMKQQFNDKYTQYNSTDIFHKLGSLNLSRIFFIVSNSTASASELLINNLKPYLNEYLVGPSKTYGKPVGFFPIPVGDWYIFPVSFRTTNKNGEGSYFGGLNLSNQVADGLDKDWGDLNESSLKTAISFISTGAFRTQSTADNATIHAQQEVSTGNSILDAPAFKGAVDTRKWR